MNHYVLQRVSMHLSPTHYDDKFKTAAFWNGKQKPSKMIVGKNEIVSLFLALVA